MIERRKPTEVMTVPPLTKHSTGCSDVGDRWGCRVVQTLSPTSIKTAGPGWGDDALLEAEKPRLVG